ncbi:MAG: hypothetical protein P4L33_08040 [Capsulimonadaceae bacterium]|nr:hypothetical protein [Capsulimonadaceae bacterium]
MIKDVLAFDWDAPLAPADRAKMLEELASKVVARGLQTPVIWMLEIHGPLMPLVGQATIAFSPAFATLFAGGAAELQKYTRLMREPGSTDELVRLIERKTEEGQLGAR